jgi:hypothetical protein
MVFVKYLLGFGLGIDPGQASVIINGWKESLLGWVPKCGHAKTWASI